MFTRTTIATVTGFLSRADYYLPRALFVFIVSIDYPQITFCLGAMMAISASFWFFVQTVDGRKAVYATAMLMGSGGSVMLVTSQSLIAQLIGQDKVNNWLNHKNYNLHNCDLFKNSYFPLIHLLSCIGQFDIGQCNKPITFKVVLSIDQSHSKLKF